MTYLWTERYRPHGLGEVAGHAEVAHECLDFLRDWKMGQGLFVWGPSGVGKTTLMGALAHEAGFELVEVNASEVRTEGALRQFRQSVQGTHSVASYWNGKPRRLMVLLDEVDAWGKDAVGEIKRWITTSPVPLCFTGNEVLGPLRKLCWVRLMVAPSTAEIVPFLRGVCRKEGLNQTDAELETLCRVVRGDIRQALVHLQFPWASYFPVEPLKQGELPKHAPRTTPPQTLWDV